MRKALVASLILCGYSAHAQFAARWNFQDYVQSPQAIKRIELTELWNITVFGTTNFIVGQKQTRQTDSSGSLVISNMVPGAYRVSFIGVITNSFTNVFGTNLTGLVNAADYLGVSTNSVLGDSYAYTRNQADAKFLSKVLPSIVGYVPTATDTNGGYDWELPGGPGGGISLAQGSNIVNGATGVIQTNGAARGSTFQFSPTGTNVIQAIGDVRYDPINTALAVQASVNLHSNEWINGSNNLNTAIGGKIAISGGFGTGNTFSNMTVQQGNGVGRFTLTNGNFIFNEIDYSHTPLGAQNTAIGLSTMQNLSSGQENVAVGEFALNNLGAGNNNIGIGENAMLNIADGHHNIGIGLSALPNIEGDVGNIGIGNNAGQNLSGGNSNIYIGSFGGATFESGIVRIGQVGIHTDFYFAGVGHGDGSLFTALNASAVSSGTLSPARLSFGTSNFVASVAPFAGFTVTYTTNSFGVVTATLVNGNVLTNGSTLDATKLSGLIPQSSLLSFILTNNWQGTIATAGLNVSGGFTNGQATASTLALFDANKKETSLANGGANTVAHGTTPPAYSAVVESDLGLTDVTTANASSSAHGFLAKLPNDATKVIDGTGAGVTFQGTNAALDTATLSPTSNATNYSSWLRSGLTGTHTIYGANSNISLSLIGTNLADVTRTIFVNNYTSAVNCNIAFTFTYATNQNFSAVVSNGYAAYFTFHNPDTTGTNVSVLDAGRMHH